MNRPVAPPTGLLGALAAIAVLAGCGSTGQESVTPPGATTSVGVTTDVAPTDTRPAATVGDTTSPVATAATATTAGALDIPVVTFAGRQRDVPVPYFGRQLADGSGATAADGFEPAAADAAFCSALDVINARPQPSDDFEEVVVAQQYFVAIESVVPDELSADFAVALAWAAQVVEDGSFDDSTEPVDGDALLTAVETITAFVDARCLGY